MGFWEGVGSFLGEAAGKIQEQNKLQKSFEEEYSSLNNAELKSELNRWKSKSNRFTIIWKYTSSIYMSFVIKFFSAFY